jgi:hypothetical protein
VSELQQSLDELLEKEKELFNRRIVKKSSSGLGKFVKCHLIKKKR